MSSRRSSFYHKCVVHVVVSSTVQTRVDGMQCKTKCSAAPFFPPRLELPLQCRLMNHTEPAVSSTLWWRKWWTRDGWRSSQYKSLCSLPLSPSPCHQPRGLPMPIDLPMHPLPNWHQATALLLQPPHIHAEPAASSAFSVLLTVLQLSLIVFQDNATQFTEPAQSILRWT